MTPKRNTHILFMNKPGFTLAEVLVVVLISSIIVLGVNASFQQAHAIWSRVETPRPHFHISRLLFETLRNELTGLYIPPSNAQEQANTPFMLEYKQNGDQSLTFYSMTPCWETSTMASHPAKITYTFSKGQEIETGILQRVEQLWAADQPIGLEASRTITAQLLACEFLVADPNSNSDDASWLPEYTAKEKPPKALQIHLIWPGDKETQLNNFKTSFLIPCQESASQSN